MSTFAQAKKALPEFAKGLAETCHNAKELIRLVDLELFNWELGQNPLSEKQVAALRKFLQEVRP